MDNCCSSDQDQPQCPPVCPVNGQPVKPVSRATVESLVKPEIKAALLPHPYYYCDTPDCEVVYVSALGDHRITKDQLTVRVGAKEKDDPVPLCYCFGFDRQDVRDDVGATGSSDIPQNIMERMKGDGCQCELTNPKGTCCLGDIRQAVEQAQARREQGTL